MKNQFGVSPYTVGLLMTASQYIAMAFILLVEYFDNKITAKLRACPQEPLNAFEKIINNRLLLEPWNFILFYFLLGLSALGIVLCDYYGSMLSILILSSVNDFTNFNLVEFNGQINSNYALKRVGPVAQNGRRLGNCLTALTGPILYAIMPQLPFICAGSFTVLWSLVLLVSFTLRCKQI